MERQGEEFSQIAGSFPCVFGKEGFAQGISSSPFVNLPAKKEGDLRSPLGIYRLGFAFSRLQKTESKMPILPVNSYIVAVDDPESEFYNQIVDTRLLESAGWKSAEQMDREDGLYDLGVVIAYNTLNPVPGKGSCIFLHVWRNEKEGTEGCVACSRESMQAIFQFLNPALSPAILIDVELEPKEDPQKT